MKKEFKKGEFVVYTKNGVCLIDDVKLMDFAGEKSLYYILKPLSSSGSTLYVPVENEKLVSKLRPVMSKAQIDALLTDAKNYKAEWNDAKSERVELFNSVLASGDSGKLLHLIMCIYLKKQEKESIGKHLCSTDESILRTAEELIQEEFAFSLNCSHDEVNSYIQKRIIK